MIKYKKLQNNVFSYENKIHGISYDHPYITFPRKLFVDCKLQVGKMVLVEICFGKEMISFIGRISKGMHVMLVWVPLSIIRDFEIKEDTKIYVKIKLNETNVESKEDTIDLLDLNMQNIAKFSVKDQDILVRHLGSSKRQHRIHRFIDLSEQLAYIVGLYDAEGAENSFRFTNSDPKLVKTFLDSIKNIFGLGESEFDAQITLVNKNKKSKNARIFWSNLFPKLNIYPRASFKYGQGIEHGSLSVLINTITMNVIWNNIRRKVRDLLINDRKSSAAYISGVLDGDGNVHKRKSLDVRCSFDANKGYYFFSKALEILGISYGVLEEKDKNLQTITIRKWDNIIRLFISAAIFKNNLERRNKLIKYFKEHRRSKVILRTLKAIEKGNRDENSICDSMGIQRKHITRVKSYLEQLKLHNMIKLDYDKFYLEDNGKAFLSFC